MATTKNTPKPGSTGPQRPINANGKPPLYKSRTFEFDHEHERFGLVTLTIKVQAVPDGNGGVKDWVMKQRNGKSYSFPPGTYVLSFTRNSPQQLVSVKIDPDPGGGRVP